MFHEPLLRSPDGLDQHVSSSLFTPNPQLLRGCCRMSLQSALVGFLLPRAFASSITPEENVIVQTTAVAAGTMPLAAGFVGIIPALGLLNVAQDGIPPIQLSWATSIAWSFAVAYYGSVLRLCLCVFLS